MLIRSKAPFRVSFGGGGTDMPPYCTEHGGCVINTTIDRHVHVSIKPIKENKINVIFFNENEEVTFDLGDINYTENFEIFKGVVNVLNIKDGFEITVYSELPAGSGMGGSSSLCVALIGAFNEYYNMGLNKHEIAEIACHVERVELKQRGGYQDQFAAAYGGFNFIEFTEEVNVIPIKISSEMLNELQYRLILCYVGGSHFSSDIQQEVIHGYKVEKKAIMDAMSDL
ncbi:MAG: GHMP kinase, partial [Promethearchaeota archaeon]